MKKIFSQCYLALKQPKNAEKCHVFGSFKPVFSISTQLFDFKKKGVSRGSIQFLGSKYERKHQKVHWIDLHSTGNALVKHLFFHVFSQKISKLQILEKKSSFKLLRIKKEVVKQVDSWVIIQMMLKKGHPVKK